MSSPDVEQSSSVMVSAPPQRVSDRRRRQTYTFLGLFGFVFLIGLVALGNWLQWWTLGGDAQAVSITCPVQVVSEPALTRVNVYNGTGRSGLATSVARELQKRKFHVLVVGTERPAKPLNAIAQIRYGDPGAQAAHTIALEFPGKVSLVKDARDTRTVDLVLGEKYKKMQSGAKAAKAIKPKPEPDGCVTPVTTSSATTAAS